MTLVFRSLAVLTVSAVLLAVLAAFILFAPGSGLVEDVPAVASLINNTVTLLAGALAVAAWLRFRGRARWEDLIQAGAFFLLFSGGALFITLEIGRPVLGPVAGQDDPAGPGLFLSLIQSLFAALLLSASAIAAPRVTDRRLAKRPETVLVALVPALVLIITAAIGLLVFDHLPTPSPPAWLSGTGPAAIPFDGEPASAEELAARAAAGFLFLIAAARYTAVYHRSPASEPYRLFLAAGLVVAAMGELLDLAIATGAQGPLLASADLLRAGFVVLVGLGIAADIRRGLQGVREARAAVHQLRSVHGRRVVLERRAIQASNAHEDLIRELRRARLAYRRLANHLEEHPDTSRSIVSVASDLDGYLRNARFEAQLALVSLQPDEDMLALSNFWPESAGSWHGPDLPDRRTSAREPGGPARPNRRPRAT